MSERELLKLVDKLNRIIHKDAREFKGGVLAGEEAEAYNEARRVTKHIRNK